MSLYYEPMESYSHRSTPETSFILVHTTSCNMTKLKRVIGLLTADVSWVYGVSYVRFVV